MPRMTVILISVLAAYAAGTVIGPPALATVKDAAEVISPFFIISLAILIASAGYAYATIFGRRREGRRDLEDS